MVAIGRALMAAPRALAIDELSLGLAPLIVQQLAEFLLRLNEEDGVALLLVEQNARLAFELCTRAYVLEVGRLALEGESAALRDRPEVQSAYLGAAMTTFLQLIVVGLSTGSVFAVVGMSLVLIYRTTGIVNFAQGIFAVLGALLTFQFNEWLPLWLAGAVAVLLAAVAGSLLAVLAFGFSRRTTALASLIITLGASFIAEAPCCSRSATSHARIRGSPTTPGTSETSWYSPSTCSSPPLRSSLRSD